MRKIETVEDKYLDAKVREKRACTCVSHGRCCVCNEPAFLAWFNEFYCARCWSAGRTFAVKMAA